MRIVDSKRTALHEISYESPFRKFMGRSFTQPHKASIDIYVNLVTAGIARAPMLTRNRVLTMMFPQMPAYDVSGQVAEVVQSYLHSGRLMPALTGNIGRYQLSLKRDARWMFPSHSAATLQDFLARHPQSTPLIIEGSPDRVAGKSARSGVGVRQTHHFVIVKFGGVDYVVDGVRGLVFDSLAGYLDAVMLPGYWGQESVRMKWFRVFAGGRETKGGVSSVDDWQQPVTL